MGGQIASLEEVKRAASEAMADFAKDVLPGSVVRILSTRCGTARDLCFAWCSALRLCPSPSIEMASMHRLCRQASTSGYGRAEGRLNARFARCQGKRRCRLT
ncbi:hypothetical protein [Bradyrhizobium canariense]|uniref:hypothetical protein n=1 Tax=Bradyrhizobium canariense TaxID=255045 RepID=UPI0035D8DDB3